MSKQRVLLIVVLLRAILLAARSIIKDHVGDRSE